MEEGTGKSERCPGRGWAARRGRGRSPRHEGVGSAVASAKPKLSGHTGKLKQLGRARARFPRLVFRSLTTEMCENKTGWVIVLAAAVNE